MISRTLKFHSKKKKILKKKTKYVAILPHIPICFPSSETTSYMSFLDLLHATNGRNLVRWLFLHESFKAQWLNQEIGRSLVRFCSGTQIFFRVSPSRYWKNTSKANRKPTGLARLCIFPSFSKPSSEKHCRTCKSGSHSFDYVHTTWIHFRVSTSVVIGKMRPKL